MQKASKKILALRVKEGNFRQASSTVNFTNYMFEKYVKSLAIKCGFNDAKRYECKKCFFCR